MHINWYPGHMKKTKDLIKANLKLVDVVVELLDARIPCSSRNPQFDELVGQKPRVVALNKFDLADPVVTKAWIEDYKKKGITAIPVNALTGAGMKDLLSAVKETGGARVNKRVAKGADMSSVRVMIVGIPNVGKSSLINNLVGKKSAKTGNKPGVTKGKQWIRVRSDIDLFDTPGILWPKIEDEKVGMNLAYTGAIKDEILHIDDVAFHLLAVLIKKYPDLLKARYKFEELGQETLEIMDAIGRKRGCIKRGNEIDYDKVARLILDEYRKGTIGRITLEHPSEQVMAEDV
ncbi:ribosome biogenesis GTPase YlqF [Fusibacter sp. JL216-2]|uniref:ribosome biogenesis GTPase YlqF n=1 Tax=Fusibacter sp. JL216-2 TaxID=3071453 RepID=UPI003D3376FB